MSVECCCHHSGGRDNTTRIISHLIRAAVAVACLIRTAIGPSRPARRDYGPQCSIEWIGRRRLKLAALLGRLPPLAQDFGLDAQKIGFNSGRAADAP